jgi:adenosylhomocysteine nucleosidase
LKREAAILRGSGRTVLCGDAATLRARLAEAASLKPSLVISWGLCGGLDPRLCPGDLVLGAEVVSEEGAVRTDEAVTASLVERLLGAGIRVGVERFAASDAPVVTVAAKADLSRATGASAVDMESRIAGRYALEQRIPFAILRAVSDPAERDLPPLVLKAVDSDGGVDVLAVVKGLMRSPSQFAGLRAAARDSAAAFQALKRGGLLPGLFLGLGAADV